LAVVGLALAVMLIDLGAMLFARRVLVGTVTFALPVLGACWGLSNRLSLPVVHPSQLKGTRDARCELIHVASGRGVLSMSL